MWTKSRCKKNIVALKVDLHSERTGQSLCVGQIGVIEMDYGTHYAVVFSQIEWPYWCLNKKHVVKIGEL